MALDLGDLNEFFDGGMYVTIAGKRYRIPPPSAELGLWGRRASVLRTVLDADVTAEEMQRVAAEVGEPPIPEGLTLDQALLSPDIHAEMLADGVDDQAIRHLAGVVYARIVGGDDVALAFARGEAGPKGNRAERRAKAKGQKASSSGTTSTAEAATTRKAASGSGTSTRKASSPTKKASPGRKS